MFKIGLGIDVGGTNTDAVLIDLNERKILSFAKSPTIKGDFAKGVVNVLNRLDRVYFPKISLISLSTTLATNAIVEGVHRRIYGFLIGYQPGEYPPELEEEVVLVSGGHTVSGEEREPLDLERIREIVEKTHKSVEAYAVCGYFSVRNPDHELKAKNIIKEITDKPVICGHEISLHLNAFKRATTTLLNAHLIPIIQQLIQSIKQVLVQHHIVAPLMVVKGDGSLMSEKMAQDRPIETVLSGPAASVIGAKYLLEQSEEIRNAVIIDIGGTTTDISLIKNGFPRLNPHGVKIGNWKTNVMAIDLKTIPLGGDSEIIIENGGRVKIGPKRIIPLSYLGYYYPEIHNELKRMEEESLHILQQDPLNFWLRVTKKSEGDLDFLSEKILSETTENPRTLYQLVRRIGKKKSEILRKLSYLEKRDLIQRSGITPTDILHLKGIFQAWDVEVARRGVNILCKQFRIELPILIKELREVMDRSIGVQILELILSDSVSTNKLLDECEYCKFFVDQFFQKNLAIQEVEFKARLKEKIIGIGAPAYAFLPSVSEKMGTQVIIPFYASVANAIGAITSAIIVKEEAVIKPFLNGFRLHTSLGISFFEDLQKATEEGKKTIKEVLLDKARIGGAEKIEIMIEEEENWSTAKGGEKIFIEKIICGKAIGNPKMYSEELSVKKEMSKF